MPTSTSFDLAIANARRYLEQETDQNYRAQTEELLSKAQSDSQTRDEIEARFGGFLTFGTAGLRGKMEAGFRRMNQVTYSQAAWALTQYLLFNTLNKDLNPKQNGVVIGFDARLHSREFAEIVASILSAEQIPVKIFLEPVPTPLCAFALTHQKACAGVVIKDTMCFL